MISIKINNIKNFTSMLLAGTIFDRLELVEAQIMTHSSFTISGKKITSYFTDSDETNESIYNSWSLLRPVCYEIIKGKKLPAYFKFIMRMDADTIHNITAGLDEYTDSDIDGLYINIKYESGALSVTTGTSLKTFTLDRTLEKAFDHYIITFFESNSIDFSIC